MKTPEQNDRHERSAVKKSNKKQAAKANRHLAKLDPENAPKKRRYKSYSG